MSTKKINKESSTGESKALSSKALRVKIATLEKEVTKNIKNEAIKDVLEDKIKVLEKEIKTAQQQGSISKAEAEMFDEQVDRLDDMID